MEPSRDELKAELAELRTEVRTLKSSVEDLVNAWRAANALVQLVKWTSTVGAAIVGIIYYFKSGQ